MAWNQPNKDNRNDNVEKLQDMVQNTIENIEKAEESLAFSDGVQREQIEAKNERRRESLESFRSEIQDESEARQNGYQE
ncbi:small acid-soluble spore protein Tlp [Peribacillus acanthi]|uniref:small acid-soluble spore protein Tlp n=1 Tax=Peribacillus acanthi TaxID=2171554 RepID=UPI000D3EA498|nr:small acid-soluble spore protein Tlp [Peribacillus acanthi]